MKPFNLKEALEGKRVVDRDGIEITQIHKFDISGINPKWASEFNIRGVSDRGITAFREADLLMASEKKEGWINIYHNHPYSPFEHIHGTKIFQTQKEAELMASLYRVSTIRIEWEE